jgi:FkbM family methyltransferase
MWWPDGDKHCHKVVPRQVRDADRAIALCRRTRTCIQAGGNVGVWANHLAKMFKTVWTFEPDWENYRCLVKNRAEGVYAIMEALGDHEGAMGMRRAPANAGAHAMHGSGQFPVNTIDFHGGRDVDLIALDIAGMEPLALAGASETIQRYRPVLMVEDKGNSENYGVAKGWPESFPGCQVGARIRRNVILVPDD